MLHAARRCVAPPKTLGGSRDKPRGLRSALMKTQLERQTSTFRSESSFGIIPDPDEAEDFLQTGDINALQTFMTEFQIWHSGRAHTTFVETFVS